MRRGRKPRLEPATLPRLRATRGDLRFAEFCRTHLRHVKGEWAGQPLRLAPWHMRDIVEPMFGTLRPDGLRRFRTVYIEVPRRNMKSTIAAAVALYMLLYDNEPGADVVSAAADAAQADVVFSARQMVERSPTLQRVVQVYKRELLVPSTQSSYRVISSESYSKHGLSLSACIVDELHAHESRDLLDVLTTSMGSRRQPLMFVITTAGFDRNSICWQFHEHAVKVRAGIVDDPSFLGVIYAASLEDDWTSPEVWERVNPGFGVSIKRDALEQECLRAQEMPAYENAFKRLHLNIWTESSAAWLPMEYWDGGAVPVDVDALKGKPCYGGLDLSTTGDLSAFVLLFPDAQGGYDVLPFAWCTEEGIRKRSQTDRAPYDVWARGGALTATEGNVVDYDVIREQIKALAALYPIKEIAYDRWNASQIVTQLQSDGANLVPLGQGFLSLSAPSKELEKLVLSGKLRHGAHPVLRWCVSNTVIEQDAAGNIKPSKRKSTERIDLTVALVMALARASVAPARRSVYEDRGVLVL